MASVKITVSRLKNTQAKVKRIPTAVEEELRKQTLAAAKDVVDKAIAAIDAPKSGRFYNRRNKAGDYLRWRASAPGEAPARKTGLNVARIKAKKANRNGRPGAKMTLPKIYKMLEEGLRRGSIEPRPLFGPILAAYKREFKDNLDSAVRRVLGVTIRK